MRTRRISKGSCGSNAVFYHVAKDYILDVNPIARNITDDLMDCVDNCIEVPTCIAINTHKRQDSKTDCHLLKDDHISKPKMVKAKTGWSLYFTGTTDISRTVSIFAFFSLVFSNKLYVIFATKVIFCKQLFMSATQIAVYFGLVDIVNHEDAFFMICI